MIKNAFISRAALSFNPGFFSFGIFAPAAEGNIAASGESIAPRDDVPRARAPGGGPAGQRPFAFNQARLYWASSRHPLSMVSECPRPGYALSVLFTITGGTVLSFPPETSRRGPRLALATLTLVAEYGLRVAVAAWNSGRPRALEVERVAQHRERGPQRGKRKLGHALDRGRVDRDRRGGKIAAQQVLHDQPAEGMTDEDRPPF